MTEVLLFHHVLGLTPGVQAFAETLREAGHTVHTPDLFDGRTFASIGDGIEHVQSIGFGAVIGAGAHAADSLPTDLVYAGFSLGVLPAQLLAQTRLGARGALFLYSCAPVQEFSPSWPHGVPVQIHGKDADPFFAEEGDLDAARALVAAAPDDAEVFLYPGREHLFAEQGFADFDPDATALLTRRTLAFLARVG